MDEQDKIELLRQANPGKTREELEEMLDAQNEDKIEGWRKQNNDGIADVRGWRRAKDGGKGWWG